MMLVLDRAEAEQTFESFRDGFVGAVQTAYLDYASSVICRDLQHPRVRAAFIWNQILVHAQRAFADEPRFRLDSMGSYEGFVIDNRIFVRSKYAADGMFSRNARTNTSVAFHDQTQDLFGGIARVELLYTLDDLCSKVERIQIAQRHKRHILWTLDLNGSVEPSVQAVIPFVPEGPQGSPAERVLKPKKKGDQENAGAKRRSGG